MTVHLFLLGSSLVLLSGGTLGTGTSVALLSTLVAEQPVGVLGRLVVGDRTLLESNTVVDGQDAGGGRDDVLALLSGLDVLGGSVTTLSLAVAAGEEDEALLVLLETLDVGLEALLGEVLAAGIDGNADSVRELAGNTSLCRFVSECVSLRCK